MTLPLMESRTTPTDRVSPAWLLADAGAVVLFAAIGRRSHDHGLSLLGIARTAAPFLGGLAIGWAASRAWKRPLDVPRTGVVVWLSTLAGGMAIRVLIGDGTAVSFVIVAGTTLAVFLLGWRGLASLLRSRRAASAR